MSVVERQSTYVLWTDLLKLDNVVGSGRWSLVTPGRVMRGEDKQRMLWPIDSQKQWRNYSMHVLAITCSRSYSRLTWIDAVYSKVLTFNILIAMNYLRRLVTYSKVL